VRADEEERHARHPTEREVAARTPASLEVRLERVKQRHEREPGHDSRHPGKERRAEQEARRGGEEGHGAPGGGH
jgi:hypothetical protein